MNIEQLKKIIEEKVQPKRAQAKTLSTELDIKYFVEDFFPISDQWSEVLDFFDLEVDRNAERKIESILETVSRSIGLDELSELLSLSESKEGWSLSYQWIDHDYWSCAKPNEATQPQPVTNDRPIIKQLALFE